MQGHIGGGINCCIFGDTDIQSGFIGKMERAADDKLKRRPRQLPQVASLKEWGMTGELRFEIDPIGRPPAEAEGAEAGQIFLLTFEDRAVGHRHATESAEKGEVAQRR